MQNRLINTIVHHCIIIFLSSSMDSTTCPNMVAAQATYEPDFLIAQQHLQAVADMLANTTFQAMDVDPRADATASLSAIRAILSPESREIRAELAEEAKRDEDVHSNALVSIGGTDTAGIDETGRHDSVTTGYDDIEAIDAVDGVGPARRTNEPQLGPSYIRVC